MSTKEPESRSGRPRPIGRGRLTQRPIDPASGAAGTWSQCTLGGLALTAPGVAPASSDDDDAIFVHIDRVVSGTEGTFKIDIDVAGTQHDLRGEGWDVDPDENHLTACIFVQSGSIRQDIVELQGRAIFANDSANLGALVKTRANAETGQIDWDFGGFLFTGRGRVVVAEAELETD